MEMYKATLSGYSQEQLLQLNEQLLEQIATLPGVDSVTQASRGPISGGNRLVPVGTADAESKANREVNDERRAIGYSYVLVKYVATLGCSYIMGCSFTAC